MLDRKSLLKILPKKPRPVGKLTLYETLSLHFLGLKMRFARKAGYDGVKFLHHSYKLPILERLVRYGYIVDASYHKSIYTYVLWEMKDEPVVKTL